MHIRSGRDGRGVDYRPFKTYQLPELVPSTDEAGNPIRAEIKRHGGELMADYQKYVLLWPGWTHNDGKHTTVSVQFAKKVLGIEDVCGSGTVNLTNLVRSSSLPKILPEELAYHLAVNDSFYPSVGPTGKLYREAGVSNYGENNWAVAGLPSDVARDVTHVEFALPDSVVPTLNYLKWLAEGHRHHPLLGYKVDGLGTMQRESLAEITQTVAALYFRILGDFMYRADNKFWGRGPWKRWWPLVALYLHWIGRTGQGSYDTVAGLWPLKPSFREEYPEVAACLDTWAAGTMGKVRAMTGYGVDPVTVPLWDDG